MTKADLWKEVETVLGERGYTLKEQLSKGNSESHAQVWRADYKDGETITERALKISSILTMQGTSANDPLKLDELTAREVEINKKLNHPSIPKFLDFQTFRVGDFVDINVLATEYIHAQNLQTVIDQGKKVTDEKFTKKILEDVLSALHHVHSELDQQVLHRDIKPSNILSTVDKAYLFDFNFSQIGQKTVAFTVINNYGYYPADAYSGRQIASQDLCAFGNVVLALSEGKDISEIRTQQGKAGLDAVDVNLLFLSPKLKRFLKKLTTSNPALRYQTAEQALEDLKNLESLTEEVLEQKLTTLVRGKGITKLLEKLAKEDPLFDYNLLANIKSTYDDESLLEHLRRTYDREEFIIEDPRYVTNYVSLGDTVLKKGTYAGDKIELKKGQTGKIIKLKGEKAEVKFEKVIFDVDLFDLTAVAELGFFGRTPLAATKASDMGSYFTKKHIVRYDGENKIEYRGDYIVPDGTKGLVFYKSSDNYLYIIWENRPGVKQQIKEYSQDYYVQPAITFASGSIKLVKKNYIDFEKLYPACFTEEKK